MNLVVGVDASRTFHGAVIIVTGSGEVLLSRNVDNAPGEIEKFLTEL